MTLSKSTISHPKTALKTLSAIAMALPGMQEAYGETQITRPRTTFQYTRYNEGKDKQHNPLYKVDVYQALLEIALGAKSDLTVNLAKDSMTGGSPVIITPQIVPGGQARFVIGNGGASISEKRNAIDVSGRYFGEEATATLTGNFSEEHDFRSAGGSIRISKEFNKKNTEVTFGYGVLGNRFKPVPFQRVTTIQRRHKANNVEHKVSLGIQQILTDKNYIQETLEYGYHHGYLSDPYKLFYVHGDPRALYPGTSIFIPFPLANDPSRVGQGLVQDKRPRHKSIFVTNTKFVQYISPLASSVHLAYRFVWTDWGIKSHTFEVDYFQPFWETYEVDGLVRYYSQNSAKFYSMAFYTVPTTLFPAKQLKKVGSSDYRLAKFGDINYQLAISKKFMKDKSGKISLTGGIIQRRNKYYLGKQDKIPNPVNDVRTYYVSLQLRFDL